MSCHSSTANKANISLAMSLSGVDVRRAVENAFHRLKKESKSAPGGDTAPTAEEYLAHLRRARVLAQSIESERVRDRITRQLEQAALEPVPDAATFYAYQRLVAECDVLHHAATSRTRPATATATGAGSAAEPGSAPARPVSAHSYRGKNDKIGAAFPPAPAPAQEAAPATTPPAPRQVSASAFTGKDAKAPSRPPRRQAPAPAPAPAAPATTSRAAAVSASSYRGKGSGKYPAPTRPAPAAEPAKPQPPAPVSARAYRGKGGK